MSFPQYYVTYCVMDTDAGANPFGHASLIFSKQEEDKAPVQVVDAIGFYSQPSTTTNPVIKGIKKLISLEVDLQDGHGILKQEEMCDLDGKGLHGISFEVTEQQFVTLRTQYSQIMLSEAKTIEELNKELTEQGKPVNGHTRYLAEKEKAVNRLSRLKPFHIEMQVTLNGFDSSNSYTCKNLSLELLSQNQIIPEPVKTQLLNNRATNAFPRFSNLTLPPIRLISTGNVTKSVSKRSGITYYNHDWNVSSLFWASPVFTLDTKVFDEKRDRDLCNALTDILEAIRKVEISLRTKIDELEDLSGSKELHLFRVQLQRIQNLSHLFKNANNQSSEQFNKNLLLANQIISAANWALNPYRDSVNYTFLLRCYESYFIRAALVGLIAMALSAASILIVPVSVGVGLTITSTLFTARQVYGFYNAESELLRNRTEHADLLSQGPELAANVM